MFSLPLEYNLDEDDELRAQLAVMCKQEIDAYSCGDYLHKNATLKKPKHVRTQSPVSIASTQLCPSWMETKDQALVFLTPEDRQALVEYGYCIADCCEFSSCPRTMVEIAMNYFDRFMNTSAGRKWLIYVNGNLRGTFVSLIFMTALYLALKVHGQGTHLSIETIVRVSGSNITAEQVVCMEEVFCKALEWRLNPPTSSAYIHRLLDLVPSSLLSESLKEEFHELSRLQLELAIKDYSLVPVSTSTVAYCSLKISLESLVLDDNLKPLDVTLENVKQITSIWAKALPGLDLTSSTLKHVQDSLCIGIAQNYFHLGVQDKTVGNASPSTVHKKYSSQVFLYSKSKDEVDDDDLLQYSVTSSRDEEEPLLPNWEVC